MNGRIYEAIRARVERRQPLDLYHAALEVRRARRSVRSGDHLAEPGRRHEIPRRRRRGSGLCAVDGVYTDLSIRNPLLEDGVLPDVDCAGGGAHTVSDDVEIARRLLRVGRGAVAHLGTRQGRGGRHVEFEFGHLLGVDQEWGADRAPPIAGWGARPRMAGGIRMALRSPEGGPRQGGDLEVGC
ncbi:MAG: hypothetical protein WD156_02525 [Acidimicrobiia bacterium]